MRNVTQNLTIMVSDSEMRVLTKLATRKSISKAAVIRQALRLYQTLDARLEGGEKLMLRNGKESAELVLL